MTGRLAGKVALITGAARGIGRAQAVRFAQEGADIIGAGRVRADRHGGCPVQHTGRSRSKPPAWSPRPAARMHTEIVDVRDLAGVQAATDRGVERFGGLDVVCATAGITSRGMAVDLSETAWRTMLDVNLTGVWHTCRAGAPHLIARGGGAMILTNSIAGLRGLVGVAHYTAAKHGVVGLMRSLAHELAPHNVRVNSVHPTNVDTPMIQNDAVSSAFRPDLDRPPTRAEFAEAARGDEHARGAVGRPGGRRQRRAVPGLRRGPLHHRGNPARRRRRHPAIGISTMIRCCSAVVTAGRWVAMTRA